LLKFEGLGVNIPELFFNFFVHFILLSLYKTEITLKFWMVFFKESLKGPLLDLLVYTPTISSFLPESSFSATFRQAAWTIFSGSYSKIFEASSSYFIFDLSLSNLDL